MNPPALSDLSQLSSAEKDALIIALYEQVVALTARVAALEAKLNETPKTPENSSVPPSKGQKGARPERTKRAGPRQGSLGRKGGGRLLAEEPDQTVSAKAVACQHCQARLGEDDQTLHSRYDKIDLPPVRPVVTRMERYAGRCSCCGGLTLAPVPDGMDEGSPFGPSIVATALYLRFVHAISYQRLHRLFEHLFGLMISEGALDALFRRAKPCFDHEVTAILARLRCSRIICSDETSVRVDGKTCWNWAEPAKVPPMRSIGGRQAEGFQNEQVVIHVIRKTRGAAVVAEVMDGHRPMIWVSDLYGAQQSHADQWQVCLAHQLRDCQFAIDGGGASQGTRPAQQAGVACGGDTVFAPRMKALLLRAVVLARRRKSLADSTRREYRRRLDKDLDVIMALAPINRHGKRLRKRYGKLRNDLFTFLIYPEVPPDNNGSERELRPTATYRKVTGGFRSDWAKQARGSGTRSVLEWRAEGPDLFAGVRSVIGTAARSGIDAYQAIRSTLSENSVLKPG